MNLPVLFTNPTASSRLKISNSKQAQNTPSTAKDMILKCNWCSKTWMTRTNSRPFPSSFLSISPVFVSPNNLMLESINSLINFSGTNKMRSSLTSSILKISWKLSTLMKGGCTKGLWRSLLVLRTLSGMWWAPSIKLTKDTLTSSSRNSCREAKTCITLIQTMVRNMSEVLSKHHSLFRRRVTGEYHLKRSNNTNSSMLVTNRWGSLPKVLVWLWLPFSPIYLSIDLMNILIRNLYVKKLIPKLTQ